MDGAACGEGAPVSRAEGLAAPRLVSIWFLLLDSGVPAKSTEVGLLLELGKQWPVVLEENPPGASPSLLPG